MLPTTDQQLEKMLYVTTGTRKNTGYLYLSGILFHPFSDGKLQTFFIFLQINSSFFILFCTIQGWNWFANVVFKVTLIKYYFWKVCGIRISITLACCTLESLLVSIIKHYKSFTGCLPKLARLPAQLRPLLNWNTDENWGLNFSILNHTYITILTMCPLASNWLYPRMKVGDTMDTMSSRFHCVQVTGHISQGISFNLAGGLLWWGSRHLVVLILQIF